MTSAWVRHNAIHSSWLKCLDASKCSIRGRLKGSFQVLPVVLQPYLHPRLRGHLWCLTFAAAAGLNSFELIIPVFAFRCMGKNYCWVPWNVLVQSVHICLQLSPNILLPILIAFPLCLFSPLYLHDSPSSSYFTHSPFAHIIILLPHFPQTF